MKFKKHHCRLGLGSDSMLPKKVTIWSKAWRNIRKLGQISQHHPETYGHFRSYPAVVAERQRDLHEGGRLLIHPFSLFCLSWNSLMVLVNLIHMTVSTFRLCYIFDPTDSEEYQAIDDILLSMHLLCLTDVIVKMNTGYVETKSHIVIERWLIVRHYGRRWFLPDFISCIPLAYVLNSSYVDSCRFKLIAHLMPLLRTGRIYTVVKDLAIFIKIFSSSYIYYGLVRLAVMFLVIAHWCSCAIYLPPVFSYYWFLEFPKNYNSFLNAADENLLNLSIGNRYTKSVFISLSAFCGTGFSMFRAAEPDEIVVHALVILCSGMFMIYTFAFLLKIYMITFSSTIRYYELMNQVEEYMKYKQFPAQLKKRVHTFYTYRYHNQYFREDTAFDCLSEELRNEIILHTCYKLVDKVALFKDVPASVVGSVLGCLKPEVYLPNDSVVRAGDIGDCMYFVANGTVAVYSLKGVEVCHLEDGAHFGEVALLMKDSKRVATIVAVEITELYRLDAVHFKQFILSNELLHERIAALASQRMHETVLLDEDFRKERERSNEPQESSQTDVKNL